MCSFLICICHLTHKNRQRKTKNRIATLLGRQKKCRTGTFFWWLETVKMRQIGRMAGAAVLLKSGLLWRVDEHAGAAHWVLPSSASFKRIPNHQSQFNQNNYLGPKVFIHFYYFETGRLAMLFSSMFWWSQPQDGPLNVLSIYKDDHKTTKRLTTSRRSADMWWRRCSCVIISGTSSAGQTVSLARLDPGRSAAQQHSRRRKPERSLRACAMLSKRTCCYCDGADCRRVLIVQQRIERGCAPSPTRVSDPKAAPQRSEAPQRESAGTRAEWQPPALAWLMAGHSLALSICVLATQAVREPAAEWQWPLRLFDASHHAGSTSQRRSFSWKPSTLVRCACVLHACAAVVSMPCSLTSNAVRCAALRCAAPVCRCWWSKRQCAATAAHGASTSVHDDDDDDDEDDDKDGSSAAAEGARGVWHACSARRCS